VPAYFIAIARDLAADPRVMLPYQQQVEATMALYGGRYRVLLRHEIEAVEGDWRPPLGLVIVEFPTVEQARAWYHSPEYAPLLQHRHAHEHFDCIIVDGLPEGVTLLSLGVLSPAERERVERVGSSWDEPTQMR
jgi:uncharacterized protein (DUF1330 family)